MKHGSIIIAVICLVIHILIGQSSPANTFIVMNTNDSGPGSLRQAIIDANEHVGPDSLVFHIPFGDSGYDSTVGVWTIRLQSGLPALTDDKTLIDGSTQIEFIGSDTNPAGLEIELDGTHIDTLSPGAIQITSRGNTVKGLVVNRTKTVGILISTYREYNKIFGNFIGTDPTGTEDRGNGVGIRIVDHVYSNGKNVIGGVEQGQGNLISGNRYGIEIEDSRHNTISGNLIGLDATGTFPIPNDSCAILIKGKTAETKVGPSNLIGHNYGYGIYCQTQNNNTITDNEIISNGKEGIYLDGGTINVTRNIIRRNTNGIYVDNCTSVPTVENNIIAENQSAGVVVRNIDCAGGRLHDNNIYANKTFGVYSDAPSFVVNAHWNWWGHESGPYHPETNPDGSGNGVSDGVDYSPWQTGYVSVRVEAIASGYQTFGGSSELTFRITNSGDVRDTYGLSVSDSFDWDIDIASVEISIDAGADTTASFFISSPPGISPWITNSVSLTVLSHLTTATDSDTLTVLAGLSGDVNGDGIVNILDAVLVANCVICCWDPVIIYFGDCYRDEFFNILDLLGIANQILGISTCEP